MARIKLTPEEKIQRFIAGESVALKLVGTRLLLVLIAIANTPKAAWVVGQFSEPDSIGAWAFAITYEVGLIIFAYQYMERQVNNATSTIKADTKILWNAVLVLAVISGFANATYFISHSTLAGNGVSSSSIVNIIVGVVMGVSAPALAWIVARVAGDESALEQAKAAEANKVEQSRIVADVEALRLANVAIIKKLIDSAKLRGAVRHAPGNVLLAMETGNVDVFTDWIDSLHDEPVQFKAPVFEPILPKIQAKAIVEPAPEPVAEPAPNVDDLTPLKLGQIRATVALYAKDEKASTKAVMGVIGVNSISTASEIRSMAVDRGFLAKLGPRQYQPNGVAVPDTPNG